MSEPVCPSGYTCKFDPPDTPFIGPWWEGPWGIVVGICAVLALTVILCTLIYWVHNTRIEGQRLTDRLQSEKARRQHELDMAEQNTMQMDIQKDIQARELEILRTPKQ